MNSSITTVLPDSPKTALSPSISSTASFASLSVMQTMAPLPAARPDAFTTIGAGCSARNFLAEARSVKVSKAAVGTLYFFMISLLKALEPSSAAAAAVGPKARRPRRRNSSTTPATSGISGPMTARSICSATARSAMAPGSATSTGTHLPRFAMPGLPGAHTRVSHMVDFLTARAMACSRPPLPTTRMFIG